MALTTAGINFISQAVLGLGTPFNSENAYLGVGDSIGSFAANQIDLQGTSKVRKPMDIGYPVIDAPVVTFKATYGPSEANFDWNEWGVFNAATGGVMLNRVVESNGTKLSNQTWILEVSIAFTLGS